MSNISMKNVVMASVLAISAVTSMSANAANVAVCSGGAAGSGASFASGGSTSFVKTEFTTKCSANVFMDADDRTATLFTVGSASIKGKKYYGGSTAGGAVTALGECAGIAGGGACAQTDSAQGATDAPSS